MNLEKYIYQKMAAAVRQLRRAVLGGVTLPDGRRVSLSTYMAPVGLGVGVYNHDAGLVVRHNDAPAVVLPLFAQPMAVAREARQLAAALR